MLSFSLDDPNSLETLKQEWLKHCYEHRDDMKNQIYYCMVGLKSDLVKPNCLLSRRAKVRKIWIRIHELNFRIESSNEYYI